MQQPLNVSISVCFVLLLFLVELQARKYVDAFESSWQQRRGHHRVTAPSTYDQTDDGYLGDAGYDAHKRRAALEGVIHNAQLVRPAVEGKNSRQQTFTDNNEMDHPQNSTHWDKLPHSPGDTHIDINTVPGTPGVDYPTFTYVPHTKFYCSHHQHPGYYADVEAGCQAFHVCDTDGRHDSFLCPTGTVFNQPYRICDWWFNVDCLRASDYYAQNANLHAPPHSSSNADKNLLL